MFKAKTADSASADAVPEYAPTPGEDFRADLAPTTPPQWDAATDDPAHPLHYHSMPIVGPSPEPEKD